MYIDISGKYLRLSGRFGGGILGSCPKQLCRTFRRLFNTFQSALTTRHDSHSNAIETSAVMITRSVGLFGNNDTPNKAEKA